MTFHVWDVPAVAVPRAVAMLATNRFGLRGTRGLQFAKSLGTGGASFTPTDTTPRRWALLASWDSPAHARAFTSSALCRRWSRLAENTARFDLAPLVSRGRWSHREPFGQPTPSPYDGTVVAITRARLRAARARMFWRATPPVAGELGQAPGLRLTFGFGEAPLGVQGTFSVWDSPADLRRFAYGTASHREAIARTPKVGWYAEELFARFALLGGTGVVDAVAVPDLGSR